VVEVVASVVVHKYLEKLLSYHHVRLLPAILD